MSFPYDSADEFVQAMEVNNDIALGTGVHFVREQHSQNNHPTFDLRDCCSAIIKSYIDSSGFFSHHTRRARNILGAIKACQSPQQVTNVIANEISLMTSGKRVDNFANRSFPEIYQKSLYAEFIDHRESNLINSAYYRALKQSNWLLKEYDKTKASSANRTEIKNIALTGGGARGAIYPGVYKAIKDIGLLDDAVEISGSSVGALSAALWATRIDPDVFINFTRKTNFKGLLGDKSGFISRTGEPLLANLRQMINDNIRTAISGVNFDELNIDEEYRCRLRLIHTKLERNYVIHFYDLAILATVFPKKFKKLIVTAVCKETSKLQVFSAEQTPNVEIALACRASASLPIIFDPVKIGNYSYLDGGLFDNTPVKYFTDTDRRKTLVFAFDQKQSFLDYRDNYFPEFRPYNPSIKDIITRDNIVNMTEGLPKDQRNTAYKALNTNRIGQLYKGQIVYLPIGNISATCFDKAQQYSDHLIYAGYKKTLEYCVHYLGKGAGLLEKLNQEQQAQAVRQREQAAVQAKRKQEFFSDATLSDGAPFI